MADALPRGIGNAIVTQHDADLLVHTLRPLLGRDEMERLPFVKEPADVREETSSVVVLENTSSRMIETLAAGGYVHQRRFALLPSRRTLRWLLPHMPERRSIDGLQLYVPYGNIGRIIKSLVVHARSAGWHGWFRDTIVVASKSPTPLEVLLTEITGEQEFVFSVSRGTPGAFQKLTVQVMRTDGSILGYVKLPATAAANDRLRNEAAIVSKLSEYAALRSHIPRLIYAGLLNARYILFQSGIEGDAGPSHYSSLHDEFLARLHECRLERRPGLHLVEEVARKWNTVAGVMGSKWESLGKQALKIAASELSDSEIRCGIAHGDFAPWNTRIHDGQLRLFDWESASWNAPLQWDRFHFLSQTACLLGVKHSNELLRVQLESNRSLYLLYLLTTAAQFWQEAAEEVVIRYREEQLTQFMALDANAA
jgi:Phosphotransferase enzyme family